VDSPSISKADANFPHGSRKQARDGSWLKTLKAQLDAKAAFQISVDRCPFGLAIAFLHSQDPFRTYGVSAQKFSVARLIRRTVGGRFNMKPRRSRLAFRQDWASLTLALSVSHDSVSSAAVQARLAGAYDGKFPKSNARPKSPGATKPKSMG
jgi:hypothetical protein